MDTHERARAVVIGILLAVIAASFVVGRTEAVPVCGAVILAEALFWAWHRGRRARP